jgi:hypothetical protein
MRAWTLVALVPLLAGCTDADWNRLLGFGDARPAPAAARRAAVATAAPAPAAAAPAPTAPQPDPFCLGIARQDAMSHDFDTATQQKTAVRSYQQCVEIFGN